MILTITMSSHSFHPYMHLLPFRRLCLGGWFLLFFLAPSLAIAMPKTDVITLVSGDVLTCEIKEMVRGQMRAKTDHIGTISIKWDKITHITSHYWFLISLKNGSLVYGQMSESPEEGQLVVTFQEKSTTIPMSEIVEIGPVRYDVWDRFEMSAAFGFNWNKGSQLFQSNLDAGVKYKGVIYNWGFSISGMITDKGEENIIRRNQSDLYLGREISGKLHGTIDAGTYRNDELGVRMRVSGGANLGYYFLRSSHLDLMAILGASINREWASADADPKNNAEGRLGTQFTLFYLDSPKSDVTVQADVYPNFTVNDRWRFEANISARQEIIKDLFVKLKYYESRDSKPPAGANATDDRGMVFAIEWSK
jgi:hypothetical protein